MTVGNDQELLHYQANGATSNDLQDAEREFLLTQVPGGVGSNQDIWLTFLLGLGYFGALDDMRYKYWMSIDPGPTPGRLFAELTLELVGVNCILDIYGGDFEIDWGDGTKIQYAGGNPTTVNVIPTGNVLIFETTTINRIRFVSDIFQEIDIKNGGNLISADNMCQNLNLLSSFKAANTGGISSFSSAWSSCYGLISFPVIDVSSGVDFTGAWIACTGLLSFPELDFNRAADFSATWENCDKLEYIGAINSLSGNVFVSTFKNCISLKCLTAINTLLQTNTNQMFDNTPALIAPNASEQSAILLGDNYINGDVCPPVVDDNFAVLTPVNFIDACSMDLYGGDFTIDWGDGSPIAYTGGNPTTVSVVPTGDILIVEVGAINRIQFISNSFTSIDIVNGTNLTNVSDMCRGLSTLTSFNAAQMGNVTNFRQAWSGCTGLTTFPLIDTSSSLNFYESWFNCSGLTSFPLINTSLGTDFIRTWQNCSSLPSFPALDFSSGIDFTSTFRDMLSLLSFPSINCQNGVDFENAWRDCVVLQSIGSLNTVSGKLFFSTFRDCFDLVCLTDVNTLLQTTTSSMFQNANALIAPSSAEQTAILAGSNYVNGGTCP